MSSETYETPSKVKDDKGKLRLDLLPWDALEEVGKILTYGIKKYPHPEENWKVNSTKEDIPRYEAALLRHMSKHMQGELLDEESGLPHIAHAVTNGLFIISLMKRWGEL